MPAIGDNTGFTLLELILALTITAMIGVIILGAFRISIRAWEKGEKDTEKHQRQRIVLNLMREQIMAISLRKIQNNGKSPFFLQGDSQNLELVSRRSLINSGGDEMVFVHYAVRSQESGERERLLYLEENKLWMHDSADVSADDSVEEAPLDAEFHELIPDAHRIRFEYLGERKVEKVEGVENVESVEEEVENTEEKLNWLPEWNQEQNAGFPRAVRISLIPETDTPPLSVIARIEAVQPS